MTEKTECPRCNQQVGMKADGGMRQHRQPDSRYACLPEPVESVAPAVPKFRLPRG